MPYTPKSRTCISTVQYWDAVHLGPLYPKSKNVWVMYNPDDTPHRTCISTVQYWDAVHLGPLYPKSKNVWVMYNPDDTPHWINYKPEETPGA